MKLATKRLILRPFTFADVDGVHAYSKKPSVTHFMVWGPNTLDDTKAFVRLVIKKGEEKPRYNYDFLVTLKDGTIIGACGIYFTDLSKAPSLGWVYDDTYWNQGYGTEAARALLAFAFNTLRLPKIRVMCIKENIGSKRIMEKVGLRFVGENYKEYPKLGKQVELVYELTALEYKLNNHKTFI